MAKKLESGIGAKGKAMDDPAPEVSQPSAPIKKTALEGLTERLKAKGMKVKATHTEQTVVAVVHQTENTNRHFSVTIQGKVTEAEAAEIEARAEKELLSPPPNPNVA